MKEVIKSKHVKAEDIANWIAELMASRKNEILKEITDINGYNEKAQVIRERLLEFYLEKIEYEKNVHSPDLAGDYKISPTILNTVVNDNLKQWMRAFLIQSKELIDFCETILKDLERMAELEGDSVATKTTQGLSWNGDWFQLTDLFRVLKNKNIKNGLNLISNTNLEIATFLKQNFMCFSKTEVRTIEAKLNSKKRPKRNQRLIE
ncbi:MAG: hypothetical protein RL007_2554 [Bacteroidota bacterium]|jgi:hypothetical protein